MENTRRFSIITSKNRRKGLDCDLNTRESAIESIRTGGNFWREDDWWLEGEEPVVLVEQTFLPLANGSTKLHWCVTWDKSFKMNKTFYL